MNNELTLEGKKYISASRASKISGYNSDYLGQLCRSGKLDCKFISRVWFVTEESLLEHQKNNGRKKIKNEFLGKLKTQNEERIQYSYKDSVREYIDEQKKLNKLNLNKELNSKQNKNSTKLFSKVELFKNTSLVLVFVILILGSFFISSNNFVEINNKQTAGLTDFIKEKLFYFDEKLRIVFKNIFEDDQDKFARNDSINNFNSDSKINFEEDETEVNNKGAVMIPIVDEDKSDISKVKNYLENSFSDEIEIIPDESGVSGYIKPVFSDPTKEEYFYVMVPVK